MGMSFLISLKVKDYFSLSLILDLKCYLRETLYILNTNVKVHVINVNKPVK